jgi:hypothetical protein
MSPPPAQRFGPEVGTVVELSFQRSGDHRVTTSRTHSGFCEHRATQLALKRQDLAQLDPTSNGY